LTSITSFTVVCTFRPALPVTSLPIDFHSHITMCKQVTTRPRSPLARNDDHRNEVTKRVPKKMCMPIHAGSLREKWDLITPFPFTD
jgi:hypothetical protein